jgi:ankyrin repeat protein
MGLYLQDGSTALHYAAAFGQAHMIQVLVRLGCDVNVRDEAENTPLHLAAGGKPQPAPLSSTLFLASLF